ncbi:kinase-like protein [Bipolaris maydis]|nr:kinase-like protein [Bipolaris maydis]
MSPHRELLMVGMAANTYRIGNVVRKECHILTTDEAITQQNLEACETEALVYQILGQHPCIAECLLISPTHDYIELKYYPSSNLKTYINKNRGNITITDLKRWAYQMVESVAYIHSKGIIHSDLRLEQWLVDTNLSARLGDFNNAGFRDQPDLGIRARRPLGLEIPTHYLPRDLDKEATAVADLFALGSSLYELSTGRCPYEGQDEESIHYMFERGEFPSTETLLFGEIIMNCWRKAYNCAQDILDHGNFGG